MVHSEDGFREKTEAQPIGKSSCANESSRELEQKEKEIVRSLMIAEKDKREAMLSLEQIKKLNDQFQGLIHDFYKDKEKEAEELQFSFEYVQPPTQDFVEQRRKSLPLGCENLSPNISPAHAHNSMQENYVETIRNKEIELRRVSARAQQEAAKAAFLRKKKDEIQQKLLAEMNKWRGAIKQIKDGIDRKEKEIVRLSFMAEQDKKSGMFLSQQISQLKKSLEGFLQAREDSKPENLCNIMSRCSSTPDFGSPPSSPLHAAPLSRSSASTTLMHTALGREMEACLFEDEKKTLELARVRCIVEQEKQRLEGLKTKVEELKQGLVAELQGADEQLGIKIQEFMQKQQAIEKVAARAERERNRSYFLKQEIIKLTNALGGTVSTTSSKKKGAKGNEYGPDFAYLSEFSELCDLEPNTNPSPPNANTTTTTTANAATTTTATTTATTSATGISSSSSSIPNATPNTTTPTNNLPSSLPLAIVRNLQQCDPTMYIFSPPSRMIPISPASECIYMQKLKDIATLDRETSKKDEELSRLKRLAEAERCRHLLLKDKFEELRGEMREREGHTL